MASDDVSRQIETLANQVEIIREESATKKQLKEAYRRLAKRCHPDKTRDDRANMAFDALRDAFDLLQDQRLREEHDRKLEREDREREQKRRRQRAAIVRAAVGALRRLGRTVVGAIVKFF